MNYIVFDLEWNQPNDGKDSSERELLFEIIEIGAVKLDKNRNIISKFNELVRPKVYKQLNWRTQKMMNMKMKDLIRYGSPFPDVFRRFMEWCGEDVMFCTWGTQDLTELQRNIHYYDMEPLSNGPIGFYDVQRMFSQHMNEENVTRNLEAAVDMIEIDKDIPFHRAYSDAYYTAKIFAEFDKKLLGMGLSYDLYHLPASKKDEVHILQGKNYYSVSEGYKERTDITENRRILGMTCAKCGGRNVRPKIRWFSSGTKVYYGAAICSIHGPMSCKLRIKKHECGLYYIEKFIKYSSMEAIEQIRKKKVDLKGKE